MSVESPNVHNIWGWARLKAEVQNHSCHCHVEPASRTHISIKLDQKWKGEAGITHPSVGCGWPVRRCAHCQTWLQSVCPACPQFQSDFNAVSASLRKLLTFPSCRLNSLQEGHRRERAWVGTVSSADPAVWHHREPLISGCGCLFKKFFSLDETRDTR